MTMVFFPLLLPPEICQLPELKEVCDTKHCLCEPQAYNALANVCCLHRIIQGLWQFKKLNICRTGNCPNTRMLGMYTWIKYKLQHATNQYHIAYSALLALDPNGAWKEQLKELKPTDLWGPGRDTDNPEEAKMSNGNSCPHHNHWALIDVPLQCFSVPHRFLQDWRDSWGFLRILEDSCRTTL